MEACGDDQEVSLLSATANERDNREGKDDLPSTLDEYSKERHRNLPWIILPWLLAFILAIFLARERMSKSDTSLGTFANGFATEFSEFIAEETKFHKLAEL
jgi:hypothetical protein